MLSVNFVPLTAGKSNFPFGSVAVSELSPLSEITLTIAPGTDKLGRIYNGAAYFAPILRARRYKKEKNK